MDMHLLRRIALAACLATLIIMGVLHPENAPLRPAMGFAAFGALFLAATVGLGLYFEVGSKAVSALGHFLLKSEAANLMGGIFALALGGLGFIAWSEMSVAQQIPFAAAVIIGAGAAFWEHIVDVTPDGTPIMDH